MNDDRCFEENGKLYMKFDAVHFSSKDGVIVISISYKDVEIGAYKPITMPDGASFALKGFEGKMEVNRES